MSVTAYQVYENVRMMQLQNFKLHGKYFFKRKALHYAQLHFNREELNVKKEWNGMSEYDKKEYKEIATNYNTETA